VRPTMCGKPSRQAGGVRRKAPAVPQGGERPAQAAARGHDAKQCVVKDLLLKKSGDAALRGGKRSRISRRRKG
jgi:hypothetical protein